MDSSPRFLKRVQQRYKGVNVSRGEGQNPSMSARLEMCYGAQPLLQFGINAWYLDDGTLCGSARDLKAALTIIEGEDPALGLHLNRAKSLLYIPEGASPATNPLPPDIPTTSEVSSSWDLPSGLLLFQNLLFSGG